MNCPKCNSANIGVLDSNRPVRRHPMPLNSFRRRRVCKDCGERWNTYEIGERELLDLLKVTSERSEDA